MDWRIIGCIEMIIGGFLMFLGILAIEFIVNLTAAYAIVAAVGALWMSVGMWTYSSSKSASDLYKVKEEIIEEIRKLGKQSKETGHARKPKK